MHLKTNTSLIRQFIRTLFYIAIPFFLIGCAVKPWTDPLVESDADNTHLIIDALLERDKECSNTLDADLKIGLTSALGKNALSGHLQFSMPSSFRFAVVNPFGQPVFMVAGDQKTFQSVNTVNRKYLSGRLRSFFLLNNIPTFFLNERWGDWLTSRNSFSSEKISDVRQDREQRGVWITFQHEAGESIQKTHVLLAPDNTSFLARVLEGNKGEILATTHYSNWVMAGRCSQPLNIDTTGLDYGSDIHLSLTNIHTLEEKKKYTVPPPPGFNRQYLP